MPVTRLNYFEAKPGKIAELTGLLEFVVDVVSASQGCISCQLLLAQDEPNQLVIIEVWESMEAHQAAAAVVPTDMLEQAMALFARPASGSYYRLVNEG